MKGLSIAYYYKVFRCIKSARTIEHIETCERMINNVKGLLATEFLADMALIKKVELMTTQYQEEAI